MLRPATSVVTGPVTKVVPPIPEVPEVVESLGCLATPSLWFFDPQHAQNVMPVVYTHLVSTARDKVRVWDPYVQQADAPLLSSLKPGVLLHVLTAVGFENGSAPRVSAFVAALVQQGILSGAVDVKCHDRVSGIHRPFHDRYLFIDESEVYKIGASLDYHRRMQTASHAIVRIDAPVAQKLLRNRFTVMWDHAHTKSVT